MEARTLDINGDTPLDSNGALFKKWRVQADDTISGWAWDVTTLRFLGAQRELLQPTAAFASDSACEGYGPDRAVLYDGVWGGRRSANFKEGFFLGAEFDEAVCVSGVLLSEPSTAEHAPRDDVEVRLQFLENGVWQTLRNLTLAERIDVKPYPEAPEGLGFLKWRIQADTTTSGWSWDVENLRFFDAADTVLRPVAAFSSGFAADGYEPECAVLKDGAWGGRMENTTDGFFIGGEFPVRVAVNRVKFNEPSFDEHSPGEDVVVRLQYLKEGTWTTLRAVSSKERSDELPPIPERLLQEAPCASECVVEPSRPLRGRVHECCISSQLHSHRSAPFQPDPSFYLSENCEGLWVCVSRKCGDETLRRACDLVREYFPQRLRALWGAFRSPLWSKDPGPMRLVVLDNRCDEQAGIVPELQDGSGGRNGTSCPFVFSSREDFFEGIGGGAWRRTRLTTHELVHGMDMVIRQLVDPVLDETVQEYFDRYRHRFQHFTPAGAVRNAYATANRDEFLAEVVSVCRGTLDNEGVYIKCGLNTKESVRREMPDLFEFITQYFII
eukprot:TRINITY_DN12038_c0_g3_i1.p1 TRINITY_DN12038_c0_g3~~TRINITY_DN12038_c0_g3_i1.p1  ORF type:complete len:582 (-),score=81.07 TRINITY_DN12038_c0_g3_i1:96-1757(-)